MRLLSARQTYNTKARIAARRGFAITMAFFALVSMGMMLNGSLRLKEHNITRDNTLSVTQTIRALAGDTRLIFLFVMYLCHQFGSAVKSQTIIYYMKYNMDRADMTAIIMMMGVLSSFLMQPVIIWASKRIHTITLMLAGYAGACFSFIIIGISGQSMALFFTGNILYGFASAFPANLIFVYTADLAERLSQQNSFGGLVTSLLGLSARIGQSLSGAIVPAVLYLAGYVPNAQQSPLSLLGIRACMSLLIFFVFFVAVIMAGLSRRTQRIRGSVGSNHNHH